MSASVLLDTSFLISLVDSNRPHHLVAVRYFRLMLEAQIPMYFSAIAAAEFSIKQPITDLPLQQLRQLPFNITHGKVAGELWNSLWQSEDGQSRHVARDDIKLVAQACHENISFILTEDGATLARYCERASNTGRSRVKAIILSQGFDDCAFEENGQQGLGLSDD